MPKFKSRLEARVAKILGDDWDYEPEKIPFIEPAKKRRYIPDFVKKDKKIRIEVKGRLRPEDREKMVLVKEQNPDKEIILIFGRAKNKLSKKSPTTYGDWATKNGFKWFDIEDIQSRDWLYESIAL